MRDRGRGSGRRRRRARAASTSSCRRTTKGRCPTAISPCRRTTYRSFALLRSNLKSGSDADLARAVAYGKRVKLYPLAQAENAPPTTFVDAADVVFDATIPYDATFFEALDRRVQAEPWLTRDKAMIDMLKTIGIEKGKPFTPDSDTQTTLSEAMTEAHAWLDCQYEQVFTSPFYDNARWVLPVSPELVEATSSGYANPDSYPVDARGVSYSLATSAPNRWGRVSSI